MLILSDKNNNIFIFEIAYINTKKIKFMVKMLK